MTNLRHVLGSLCCVAALVAGGCANDSDDVATTDTESADTESTDTTSADDAGAGSEDGFNTLRVPDDFDTIQAAVDASQPGDLVLIGEGVYYEGVNVETENIVVRGVDRNKVIIDGEFERDNGIKVFSNGVAIENLTVRNNNGNGVFFTGEYSDDASENKILTGYRASYITAYNNGLYGVYAFNATTGQFDNSYGSGHPDSAFYIGQCNPCNALIDNVESEKNMLGYSGTNSTGVTITNSWFHDNRSGIDPNSLDTEKLAPNNGTVIIGNIVENNDNVEAPNNTGFEVAYGNGIVLGGVSNNVVERNLVTGHLLGGIVVTDMPKGYKPEGNKVRDNVLSDNLYDLVYLTVNFASTLFGNCFEGNQVTTEFPEGLQSKSACGAPDVDLGDLSPILASLPPVPPDVDWKTMPEPPEQENMADAETAPPAPATDVPMAIDLDAIETPTK